MSMRQTHACIAVIAVLVLAPARLWAQSGFAGVVRDVSGAVLPGVTVEAASPVLIEKLRTVVTDGGGAYNIVDLRPGLYTVTFSLPGFSTVKRDGIELPAGFTATLHVELKVGELTETITVTGGAPVVDVRNVTAQTLMSQEVMESVPVASRSPQGFAALTPGITSVALGSIGGGRDEMNLSSHGSAAAETLFVIDGVNTADSENVGGSQTLYRMSQAYVSEINVVTGGGSAENQFSGTMVNVVPKEGGNQWRGGFSLEYSNQNLQSSNLTQELQDQGLTSASEVVKLWDNSPYIGGPLVGNKLWLFASYRNAGNIATRAGLYETLTPDAWVYTPDLTRPAIIKITDVSYNGRLTWQATPRHKIGTFFDYQPHIVHQRNYQSFVAPEATTLAVYPNRLKVVTYKGVLSSRLIVDANIAHNTSDTDKRRPAGMGTDTIAVREARTGLVYRSAAALTGSTNYGHAIASGIRSAAGVSYVTGTHTMKVGMTFARGDFLTNDSVNQELAYNFRDGLPISLVQFAIPSDRTNKLSSDLGLYVQDQWTMKNLTISSGLRFDYLDLESLEADLGAGRWVPARHFDGELLARWKDISPRFGVAYDLLGDGKTALKASVGRFIAGQGAGPQGIGVSNPVTRSVLSVTRNWTDTNGNFIPDCDLTNPLSQVGVDICGQINNLNFGQNNPNATTYSTDLRDGLRPDNWEFTTSVTRQLFRGASISGAYFRRSFGNFRVNDNVLIAPSDHDPYCVTAPSDPRLPGGGGERICGLYDVKQALFGQSQIVVSPDTKFGEQSQTYDGFDLTERMNLGHGVVISGGVNWARISTNACFTVDSPQQLRFCDVRPPFQPNASFAGVVPLPWWGLLSSATYRNFPGPQISAIQTYTNAEIQPSLGRPLSSGANGTVNIELIEPGTMYGARVQQVDLRLSKRFRAGERRFAGNVDLINLFNSSGVKDQNATFGPSWQNALLVQSGRYVKFSFDLGF